MKHIMRKKGKFTGGGATASVMFTSYLLYLAVLLEPHRSKELNVERSASRMCTHSGPHDTHSIYTYTMGTTRPVIRKIYRDTAPPHSCMLIKILTHTHTKVDLYPGQPFLLACVDEGMEGGADLLRQALAEAWARRHLRSDHPYGPLRCPSGT